MVHGPFIDVSYQYFSMENSVSLEWFSHSLSGCRCIGALLIVSDLTRKKNVKKKKTIVIDFISFANVENNRFPHLSIFEAFLSNDSLVFFLVSRFYQKSADKKAPIEINTIKFS